MTNQSKVAPVEAQAVPDQPVAIRYLDRNGRWRFLKYPFTYGWEFPTSLGTPEFLFTRPTPAAAVWTEEAATRTAHAAGFAGTHWIMGPEELAHLLSVAASPAAAAPQPDMAKIEQDAVSNAMLLCLPEITQAYRYFYAQGKDEKEFDRCAGEAMGKAVRYAVSLTAREVRDPMWPYAASPAAAAGVPTDAMSVLRELFEAHIAYASYRSADGHEAHVRNRERYTAAWSAAKLLCMAAPVAPVGAPTEEKPECICSLADIHWECPLHGGEA